MSKARVRLLTLILLLGSLLVAFVIGEIVIRLTYPEIGRAQHRDTTLGWAGNEYKEFNPTLDADDGRTRLMVLGDSFLAGSGVRSMASRFPTVLGRQLSDQLVTRILATGGWGTDQELLAFREKGAAWRPDIVILAFCANNDTANNLSNDDNMHKPKPYFAIEDGELNLFDNEGNKQDYDTYGQQNEASSWLPRSYLIDFTKHILFGQRVDEGVSGTELKKQYPNVDKRYLLFAKRNFKRSDIHSRKNRLTWSPQRDVTPFSAYIHEDFELNAYQWELMEGIVGRLKEEVEAAGGKLFIMLLPVIINPRDATTITGNTFEQRFETPDGPVTIRSAEPRERLATLTKRLDIQLLDPTQEFIGYVEENDLLRKIWPRANDRHFSEVGHRFLADWLSNHNEMFKDTMDQQHKRTIRTPLPNQK
jgi:lysophospholipase L1-like esterase